MFRKEGKRVSEAYDLPDPTHAPLKGPAPELWRRWPQLVLLLKTDLGRSKASRFTSGWVF